MVIWNALVSSTSVLLQAIVIVVTVAFVQVRQLLSKKDHCFYVNSSIKKTEVVVCALCCEWLRNVLSSKCLPFLKCRICPALTVLTFMHVYQYYTQQ